MTLIWLYSMELFYLVVFYVVLSLLLFDLY